MHVLCLSQQPSSEEAADGAQLLNKGSTTMHFCTLPAKYKSKRPGVIFADILPAVEATAFQQPGIESLSCFEEESYISIGNGHLLGDGERFSFNLARQLRSCANAVR